MTKHILILFLFGFCLLTMPAPAQVQVQMLENINKTKNEIAALEKKIADAKTNKEDPAIIKMMEDQLPMMKEMLATLQDINKDLAITREQTSAVQDDNIVSVPKRDSKRINMLPDGILTDAQLVPFVKKISSEAERLIPATEKNNALEIYTAAKSEKKSSGYMGNIAVNLWMTGNTESAIYIIGKVCIDDISNSNNLNNYAAFLSMSGAEHAALPILLSLNNKFPGNSTINNNIGQAWYELGDMTNANKFLDTAIKLYPRHSQANITKSKIQKAGGKTQEAIESIKRSIEENYTTEKEAMLDKLGGKLKLNDLPFWYTVKPEPLGIEKFLLTIPAYVMDGGIAAAISEMEWDEFKEKVTAAKDKIDGEIKPLEAKADLYNISFLANPMIQMPYNNSVFRTAKRKMDLLFEWAAERLPALEKKMKGVKDSVDKWRGEYHLAVNAHKEYNNSRGIDGDCGVLKSLATVFNVKANTILQQTNNELLSFCKEFFNIWSNLSLFAATDKSLYDLWIATIKKKLLGYLFNLQHENEVGCIPTKPEQGKMGALPDFDEMHCTYKSRIFIPPFTTIDINCNKMTTEFEIDLKLIPKTKIKLEDDLKSGKTTKGTIEIGYSKTIDKVDLGPLKAEAKAEVAVGVELTEAGLSDVYVKGGVKGKIGTNLNTEVKGKEYNPATGKDDLILQEIPDTDPRYIRDQSLTTTGIEVKLSLNSGASLSGKGLLRNININVPPNK